MKLKLTFISFFISIIAHANFEHATILFNDGHTETGLMKSFLEQRIIDFKLNSSVEHQLHLDDKSIKFKIAENDQLREISIDDINELTLLWADGNTTVFKVIYLKELSTTGEVTNEQTKVFLPYVKKGRINIYGIKYTETNSRPNGIEMYTSKGMRFYYQNEKENYAIDYFDMGILGMMNIKSRILNPFKDLFKDCPELLAEIDKTYEDFFKATDANKETKREYKELQKQFKALPKEEREKLVVYHHYNFGWIEKMITKYESCK